MVNFVGMAAGSASAMIGAGAASVLIEAIPQGIALFVALQSWNEPCNQPLQLWLAVVGGVSLLITVPAVIILCRERRKINETVGNEELVSYMVRKQRAEQDHQHFEEISEFEEELQETMGSESRPSCADSLMRCLQCPLLVWQISGIVWYCKSSPEDEICREKLRHWTLGILLLKFLMPCVTCCCVIICGVGAGLTHLPEAVSDGSSSE